MANNYGDLGVANGVYAESKMLEHAAPILVLNKLGDHKPMPKNASQVIRFKRPNVLPLATTAMTEGVRPSGVDFRYTRFNITLQQYGSWAPITDVVADLHEDPVGSDLAKMMGEQAAETIEKVAYGTLIAGSNVLWANGGARAAVNTFLTLSHIRQAVRTLMAARAKKITSILSGSTMINTTPVEAAYVAICHTDIIASVRSIPGFVPVAEYGQRKLLCDEEVGSIEDVRFIASPLFNSWPGSGTVGGAKGSGAAECISANGTNADVYPVIFLGQNAFGHIALKGSKEAGGAIKPMLRNPGTPTFGDELGQQGSVSWKTYYTCAILNDLWMLRYEVAAPKTPA